MIEKIRKEYHDEKKEESTEVTINSEQEFDKFSYDLNELDESEIVDAINE